MNYELSSFLFSFQVENLVSSHPLHLGRLQFVKLMRDEPEQHILGDRGGKPMEGECEEGADIAVAVAHIFLLYQTDALHGMQFYQSSCNHTAPPARTVLDPEGKRSVGPFVLVQMEIDVRCGGVRFTHGQSITAAT